MAEDNPIPQPRPIPEVSEGFRFTPRRLLAVLALLGAGGALLVFGGPRSVQWWRHRSAESLSQKAEARLKAGDFEETSRLLGEAYQADPANRSVMRAMARLLDQTNGGADRAAFFWQQLNNSAQATTEDHAGLAGAMLRLGRPGSAREILEKLPAADRRSRLALELEAGLLRYEGLPARAEAKLREAYALAPDDPESQLKLNQLDLASPFKEVQDRAEDRIWHLAQGADKLTAQRALIVLAGRPGLSVSRATEMRARVSQLDDVPGRQRYSILAGCVRAAPGLKDDIIDQETSRLAADTPETHATFFRWLISIDEPARVLDMMNQEMARRTSELLEIYITAMSKAGRHELLGKFIRRTPGLPLSAARISIVLARCASALKEPSEEIRGHLQEAVKHASVTGDRADLVTIAGVADELGQDDIALDTYELLAERPQMRLPMLDRILQIYHRQRNLPAMIATIDRCLAEKPGLSPYAETACYLRLLYGVRMEVMAIETAHLGENGVPVAATIQIARALADYRAGDLVNAGKKVNEIEASKLPPGQRAVLSGILRACGRTAEAFQLAEKVPSDIILDEEAAFLKTAL